MSYQFQNLSALIICIIISAGTKSVGQQQINNPGFENWEEIRSEVEEPVNWNSIKNTDGSRATNRFAPEVAKPYRRLTAENVPLSWSTNRLWALLPMEWYQMEQSMEKWINRKAIYTPMSARMAFPLLSNRDPTA
jgi:hypothetical protein